MAKRKGKRGPMTWTPLTREELLDRIRLMELKAQAQEVK